MRPYRFPELLRFLYPGAVFRMPPGDKKIYLSFDDGPTPGLTEKIIAILSRENVPACFFVNGINLEANPSLDKLMRSNNFGVANHGFEHWGGFSMSNEDYIANVNRGAEVSRSLVFRPAYGAIGFRQFRKLKKTYKIVFWDLMPFDFDRRLSPDKVLRIVEKKVRSGSILVLHDNNKSMCPDILAGIISLCREKGFKFGDLLYDLNNTA